MDGEDLACAFVAEDVVGGDDHGAYAAGVPEVYVASVCEKVGGLVLVRFFSFLDGRRWSGRCYPQIPVLLIAIVTCPSFSDLPSWSDSSDGSALSIHKS